MEKEQQVTPSPEVPKELRWLDGAANLLDNRFRIPGTDIRFGLDFLIGLVPYAGDIFSFSLSALLVIVMARRGAGGMALFLMAGNIFVDALAGTVPVLGDIFDLKYKANVRNLRLLQEHYREGKHTGSAWGPVLLILAIIFALSILLVYLSWQLFSWVWGFIAGA